MRNPTHKRHDQNEKSKTVPYDFKTPRHVLALDPGKTTGCAELVVNNDQVVILTTRHLDLWYGIEEILEEGSVTDVVYEGFYLMRGNVSQFMLDPIFTIGVIRYLLEKYDISSFFVQTPQQKEFAESRFRKVVQNFSSHSASAVKHGLCYVHTKLGITHPIITISANHRTKGHLKP